MPRMAAAAPEQAAAGHIGLVQVAHVQQYRLASGLARRVGHAVRDGGDQLAGVVVTGMAQHLGGRAGLDDLAQLHHGHAVGDLRPRRSHA